MHRQQLMTKASAGKTLHDALLFTRKWSYEFHSYLRNIFASFRRTRVSHFILAALAVPVALLSACSHYGDDKPVLHTTISADGKMVATLLHAGTDKQLLRVRNLDSDAQWHTIQAPPLTRTIRFGLQGHELLLTHQRPEPPVKEYLSKLDLDHPDAGLQRIHESENGLAFPVEVQPGQVMVRTSKPANPKTGERLLGDSYWILVGPGQQVQKVGPERIMPYDAPNIVGSGFFWTEEQVGKQKEAHPLVLSFPLPGGIAPMISRERLDKNTWTVNCDNSSHRCLRAFISNYDKGGDFIYDIDVLYGANQCKLTGVAGVSDPLSITPDGKAAVLALASGHNQPRHVVVMHFKPQQCEAISVQHIYFEEK